MSLLYSSLKPIVRKVVKGSSLHQEEGEREIIEDINAFFRRESNDRNAQNQ